MSLLRMLFCLGLVLLAGCGSLTATPRDHFYRLDVEAGAPPTPARGTQDSVYVAPFAANGLHSERAVVYAHADGTTLEQSAYHFWVDSPRVMLQQALTDYLREQGMPATLQRARTTARTVQGRIVRFERGAADGGSAEVLLEFEIRGPRGREPGTVRRYARSVPLGDVPMAQAVAALNRATGEIFAEFAQDLIAQP